jgi:hypothetical protein
LRFTVRRPASAEVSPCCHRPPGGDVACGVHVGVARPRTTGDARENRLTLAVFRRDMPAVGASLRRVRCWDQVKPPQSLMLQPGHQQSPPLAADLTIEAPFLRHVDARAFTSTARRRGHGPHLQVLDADGIEPARQIGGGLLHPVTPPVSFTRLQSRDSQLRACSPVRSASRPGQTPLQSAQPLGFSSAQCRGVQQLPGRQRGRHRHAAINTHHACITRSREGFRDHSKSDVPTPRSIARDTEGLHRVGDVAGPPEPHPTDLRHPHLPVAATQPLNVARFDTDLPEPLISAGLAPRRATMGTVEKVPHRLRKISQCSPASGRYPQLLCGLRSGCQPVVFGAGRRQLGGLLVVVRRLAAWLPVFLLLHGQIPHKAGMTTVLGQHFHLLRARKQTEPTHTDKVNGTTDNVPKGEKRRSSPG